MILSKKWNKDPFWFDGLTKKEQIAIIANDRIDNEPEKKQKIDIKEYILKDAKKMGRYHGDDDNEKRQI